MSKYENKVFINQYLGIWAYGYVNGFTGTEAVYRIVKSFVMEEFNKEEKLNNIIKKAKEKGIHTVIDTAGGPFTREEPFFSKFQELMKYTDLLLVDIKHIDTECHKTLTGRSNENILDMIRYLSDIKKPIWIRHVLVPERSDKDEYLTRLADFIHSLDNVEKVEILPYHTMGIYKWKELGLEYPLEGIEPPTKERVENAKKILTI